MRIAVVAQTPTFANEALVRVGCHGADWCLLTPAEALDDAAARATARSAGSTCCRRSTASTTGSGRSAPSRPAVSPCSTAPPALLAAHDKLLTARLLRRAGLPHPRTRLIAGDRPSSPLRRPSCQAAVRELGLGVERCDDDVSPVGAGSPSDEEPWYRAHGASSRSSCRPRIDLRIVVADDHVIGAISRVAAARRMADERRARRRAPRGDAAAATPARSRSRARARRALARRRRPPSPTAAAGWTVAEINGAVEFTADALRTPACRPVGARAVVDRGLKTTRVARDLGRRRR